MPNPERQGGWGAGLTTKQPANPFAQPTNPFAQAQANPFSQKQTNGTVPAPNPFSAKPPTKNPFVPSTSTAQNRTVSSPFDQLQSSATPKTNSLGKSSFAQDSKPTTTGNRNSSHTNPFTKQTSVFTNGSGAGSTPSTNGRRKVSEYVKPAWPKQDQKATESAPKSQINGKRKNENDSQRKTKLSRKSPDSGLTPFRPLSSAQDTKQETSIGDGKPASSRREDPDVFAKKILDQLEKDNIKPPRWPPNAGSFENRQAVERLRESHKAYREKARNSLMRAGLINDPDKKRRLDEALVFKGICEDMCPEWERITRIVEKDIKGPEKGIDEHGDLVVMPSLMVKRLARSAAGQESPLPMDVRSVRTLRKTLSYLTDLIEEDGHLPQRHHFLWDRTRAIRIDFSFQKYAMTPAEIQDQIYCLETIARFHVTSLHLLSRSGFTPVDFSEQQEVEQLSKTLISLMEVYDDCAQQGIKCENEAEFRGYFIIFYAFNPSLTERIEGWDRRFGEDAHGIKSAICLTECIRNVQRLQGPLAEAHTQITMDVASTFFDSIKHPSVSYTMACFAEIHFNTIRKVIVKLIKRSCSRPRYGPKDLTPAVLKQHLYTDTEEEAVDFFVKHGFQFDSDGGYLILSPSPDYTDTRVPHPFSGDIVERKRMGRSFTEVVHSTVYESDTSMMLLEPEVETGNWTNEEEDSLFVSNSQDVLSSNGQEQHGHLEKHDSEAQSKGQIPPSYSQPTLGNHAITKPGVASPFGQSPSPTPNFAQTRQDASSIPTGQSNASIFGQPNTQSGAHATNPFSLGQTHTSISTPMAQTNTLTFTQPGNKFGAQSTNFALPNAAPPSLGNTLGTNPLSSVEPDNGKVTNQTRPEGLSTQSTSITKKVRFENTLSGPKATAPATTPNLFGFLNNKSEDKGLGAMPATPSTIPFSGLLSNKDTAQPPIPSELGASAAQPQIASPSTFPAFTNVQPSNAPRPEKPNSPTVQSSTIFGQQQVGLPKTTTLDVPAIAHPGSPLAEAQITAPALLSQKTDATSTTNPQNVTQRDLLSDFTKWFVFGDRGLMESQLEQVAVEYLVRNIWDEFEASEMERIRKEEEEKSWAVAREYREKYLKVKFFFQWKDGFRKRQRIRRMKMEREKARQWRLPENVAKRERAEREEKERITQEATNSIFKRSRHNVDEAVKLRESTRSTPNTRTQDFENASTSSNIELPGFRSRMQSIEDALLATGVFKGVRDEKAAARYAAMDSDAETEPEERLEKKMRLRSENIDRLKRGLRPLKTLPEPKVYKEGSKTAMLRAKCRGSDRDSMSKSTGSFRGSTFSSSYRSSLGYNSGRVTKPRSRLTDSYWRLKASGLVRMPNGEYLPESLAIPMLEGKKSIPGFGNYGLPPAESTTPAHSPPPAPALNGYSSPTIHTDAREPNEPNISPPSSKSQRRKRRVEEEDFAANGIETPPSMKRVRSGDGVVDTMTNAEDHLADIASLLKRVDSVRKSTPK